MRAQDLRLLVDNSEFYNLFLKKSEANAFRLELINVPEDIKAMLDAVSRTQVHASVIPPQLPAITFTDVNDFLRYVSASAI